MTRLFFLALLLFMAMPLHAQSTISGSVRDIDTGIPLQGVRMVLCPSAIDQDELPESLTDARGYYALAGIVSESICVQAVLQEDAVEYRLQSPTLPLGDSPLTLHFEIPTRLRERMEHTSSPTDPNPKSLSTITGLLQEGVVKDGGGLYPLR